MHLNGKWYSAGWLSLCLFSPFFIYKASKLIEGSSTHYLSLNVPPRKSQMDDFRWKASRLPKAWYETIQVTGDKNQNRKLLQNTAKKLHEIRLREDKTSGILFELSNDASYESFVEILSMLHLMQWKCYMTDDRQIWVFSVLAGLKKKKELSLRQRLKVY